MLPCAAMESESTLGTESWQRPGPDVCSEGGSWPQQLYAPFKRGADCFLAALILVTGSPFWALIAIGVRVTSPGPVIYRQTRVGRFGRRFVIFKFRTMQQEAERETGPVWALDRDPRSTSVGRWLRGIRFDEIPQLWNVLRGDMSLVGPRPERPAFVDWLEKEIPGYRDRFVVRPGVSGLAQIHGPHRPTLEGVRHKLAYDREYIRRFGPWLDLSILLRTLPYVLRSVGR